MHSFPLHRNLVYQSWNYFQFADTSRRTQISIIRSLPRPPHSFSLAPPILPLSENRPHLPTIHRPPRPINARGRKTNHLLRRFYSWKAVTPDRFPPSTAHPIPISEMVHKLLATASSTASHILISPSTICQSIFLLAAIAILSLQILLPGDARSIVMDYGARRDGRQKQQRSSSRLRLLLVRIVGLATSYGQVPHAWFWHFYLVSTGLSVFWAWQFLTRGSVMGVLVETQQEQQGPSAELGRVFLAWAMMAAQGSRRLLECFWVTRPGRTPMWFMHWVLGLLFYTVMSVAVWVEGSGESFIIYSSPSLNCLPLSSSSFLSASTVAFRCVWPSACWLWKWPAERSKVPDEGRSSKQNRGLLARGLITNR